MKKCLINFIGIGAARSGTTWIYECLKEHPGICFSNKKETYFFDNDSEYQKGMDYYASFFSDCPEQSVKGEYCATYLSSPEAAQRIKQHFSEVKILVCLRDPIQRVYSHYLYDKAEKRIDLDFRSALEKDEKYINYGLYHTNLMPYCQRFEKDKILVMIYEDIQKSPREFISRIYDFLGVDASYIPDSLEMIANPTTQKAFFVPSLNVGSVKRTTEQFKKNSFGRMVLKMLKLLKINRISNYLLRKNVKSHLARQAAIPPELSEDDKNYLRKIYTPEVRKIEELISRKLTCWDEYFN